jgi:hypothetical protein
MEKPTGTDDEKSNDVGIPPQAGRIVLTNENMGPVTFRQKTIKNFIHPIETEGASVPKIWKQKSTRLRSKYGKEKIAQATRGVAVASERGPTKEPRPLVQGRFEESEGSVQEVTATVSAVF